MMENLDRERVVTIDYINWKGERSRKEIVPEKLYFGSTKWHPTPCWLLVAFDLDRGEMRDFAMRDIFSWEGKQESLISL